MVSWALIRSLICILLPPALFACQMETKLAVSTEKNLAPVVSSLNTTPPQ